MIKRLIDELRAGKGYAGMAVYGGDIVLFNEGMAPEYMDKMRCFMAFPARKVTAVARGYTISLFEADGFVIICRFEGRFTPVPGLDNEEPEFTTGLHEAALMARETAAKEAALLLKRLMNAK
jgi:hypothetical protein